MDASEYKPTDVEKRFLKYYEKLILETIQARAHLKLWERLEGYKSSYLDELNSAPHFFNFTMKAHLDDTLMTLSRILREQNKAFTISKFLDFVEREIKVFSSEAFCHRVKCNPSYDEYWIKSHSPITKEKIEEDRRKLGSLEETITNLITWRDKVLAHIDKGFLESDRKISQEYPLKRQELEKVIQALIDILDRYSGAYDLSSFAEEFPGEDNVQFVMDCIRYYIQEQNKQIETLLKQTRDRG